MFGKGENLVATDYQMVRHPDIHQAQCLYQTFRDKAVCLAGCDFTGRVIVCQHHSSGIVIQGAFNHFTGMDFRAVDGAGEEGFTGNQLITKKPRVNARGFFSFVFLLLPKSQKSSAFYAIFPQQSEAHNHLS